MAQCKHHEICGLDAVEDADGEGLCILHSKNPEKDKKAFSTALYKHRSKTGDFSYVVFPGGTVYFNEPPFCGDIKFTQATFSGDAKFWWTVFSGNTDFNGATFKGKAEFIGVTFKGNATFIGAKFSEDAVFGEPIFAGDAHFGGADFGKRAFLSKATFKGTADFSFTTFNGETHFPCICFSQNTTFRWAAFRATTLFHCPEVKDGESPRVFSGSEVDFRHVRLDPSEALVIRHADLRKCRFTGTDLRRAEITGAKWAKMGRPFPLVPARLGVYDENALSEKKGADSYSDLERLYRQLKQNYEDRRDFERAGDFHYGEKEMRRRNPETPWGRKFLLWLYWLVSGYGERCVRPLLWAVFFLAVFTSCYFWGELLHTAKDTGSALNAVSVRDTALYGIRVMTLLKPDDFVPFGFWGRLVNTVQGLLGPLLIGLSALAVRQRLKR